MANKWIAIIFAAIVGIALGSILETEACKVARQDFGTGTSVMKLTCLILSIPTDWIILFLAVVGLVSYFVWEHHNP